MCLFKNRCHIRRSVQSSVQSQWNQIYGLGWNFNFIKRKIKGSALDQKGNLHIYIIIVEVKFCIDVVIKLVGFFWVFKNKYILFWQSFFESFSLRHFIVFNVRCNPNWDTRTQKDKNKNG